MDSFMTRALHDGGAGQEVAAEDRKGQSQLPNFVEQSAENYLETRARSEVAALLLELVDVRTDDLDFDVLGTAAGFMGQISAAVDRDGDGELDDIEQQIFERYLDATALLLSNWGVTESDVEAFLDEDEDAAERIRLLLADTLPKQGTSEAEDLICEFAVNGGAADLVMDSAAKSRWSWARRHRGRVTVNSRHGKKNVIHHRAIWKKATALQMMTLRKARARAHTAMAKTLNRRSNKRTREKLGGRRVV